VRVNPISGAQLPLFAALGGASTQAPLGFAVLVSTSGGASSILAPASPSEGSFFAVEDLDGLAAINPISILGGAELIDGAASVVLSTAGAFATFVFDRGQWRRLVARRRLDGTPAPVVEPGGGLNLQALLLEFVSDGPPGVPGAKGDKGDTGAAGAAGAAGAKGDKGDTGAAGAAGAKGDKGDKGDTGAPGAAGAPGAKGDKGDTGATGAPGAKGDKGDTGATGAEGAAGAGGAVMHWGASGLSASSTTRYLQPGYEASTAVLLAALIQWAIPRAGTLRNLRIRHNGVGSTADVLHYIVRINGVATALDCAIAANAANGSDLVHSAAVVAGDLIDIEVTKPGEIAQSPRDPMASLELA